MKSTKKHSKPFITKNHNHATSKTSYWLEAKPTKLPKKFWLSWDLIEDQSSEINSHPDMVKKVFYQCFGLKLTCHSHKPAWPQISSSTPTPSPVEWLSVCSSKVWPQSLLLLKDKRLNMKHSKPMKTTTSSITLAKSCSTMDSTTTATKPCTVELMVLNWRLIFSLVLSTTKDSGTWFTISPKPDPQDQSISWHNNLSREERKVEVSEWEKWRETPCSLMGFPKSLMKDFSEVLTSQKATFVTSVDRCCLHLKKLKRFQAIPFSKWTEYQLCVLHAAETTAVWWESHTLWSIWSTSWALWT